LFALLFQGELDWNSSSSAKREDEPTLAELPAPAPAPPNAGSSAKSEDLDLWWTESPTEGSSGDVPNKDITDNLEYAMRHGFVGDGPSSRFGERSSVGGWERDKWRPPPRATKAIVVCKSMDNPKDGIKIKVGIQQSA
jgi:hypothetical protein